MRWPWQKRRRDAEFEARLIVATQRAMAEWVPTGGRDPGATLIFIGQLIGLGYSYDEAKGLIERLGGTWPDNFPRWS